MYHSTGLQKLSETQKSKLRWQHERSRVYSPVSAERPSGSPSAVCLNTPTNTLYIHIHIYTYIHTYIHTYIYTYISSPN